MILLYFASMFFGWGAVRYIVGGRTRPIWYVLGAIFGCFSIVCDEVAETSAVSIPVVEILAQFMLVWSADVRF